LYTSPIPKLKGKLLCGVLDTFGHGAYQSDRETGDRRGNLVRPPLEAHVDKNHHRQHA